MDERVTHLFIGLAKGRLRGSVFRQVGQGNVNNLDGYPPALSYGPATAHTAAEAALRPRASVDW